MKRIIHHPVAADGQPHRVPPGVPVLFGRRAAGSPLAVWHEVDGAQFDDRDVHYVGPMTEVCVVPTGVAVPDHWRWLVSTADGSFVWHLYEVKPA